MGNKSSSTAASQLRDRLSSIRRLKGRPPEAGADGGGGSASQKATGGSFRKLRKKSRRPLTENGSSALCLSQEDIANIKESWNHLESELHNIFTEAFLSLFSEHPETKDRFFANKTYAKTLAAAGEDHVKAKVGSKVDNRKSDSAAYAAAEHQSELLQRHIPRVSRSIGKVVKHVDDLQEIADYLQVLGKIHNQAGIEMAELRLLGPFFVSAAVSFLPSHLRERRIQESWLRLFSTVGVLMNKGFPEIEYTLHEHEIEILRGQLSASTSPSKEAALNNAFQTHAMLIYKVVETVVQNINDPHKFEKYLRYLGQLHEEQEIERSLLDILGPIFVQTIRPVLQAEAQWNNDVRETWLRLFRVISHWMKQGYKGSKRPSIASNQDVQLSSVVLSTPSPEIRRLLVQSPERKSSMPNVCIGDGSKNSNRRPASGLFQKNPHLANINNNRRISSSSFCEDIILVPERRIRIQAQHCHPYYQRRPTNIGGSVTGLNGTPKRASNAGLSLDPSPNKLRTSAAVTGRKVMSQICGLAVTILSCRSRSEHDVRRALLNTTSPRAYYTPAVTSVPIPPRTPRLSAPSLLFEGNSEAGMLMRNASAAAKQAKEEQKRRSSIHNLGLALFSSSSESRGRGRPRSKSATIRDKING